MPGVIACGRVFHMASTDEPVHAVRVLADPETSTSGAGKTRSDTGIPCTA